MFARRLAVRFRSLIGPGRPLLKPHDSPPAGPLIPYKMLSEMQCLLFDRQLLAFLDPELLSGYRPSGGLDEHHKSDVETWLDRVRVRDTDPGQGPFFACLDCTC
jgi:hypothetical protein